MGLTIAKVFGEFNKIHTCHTMEKLTCFVGLDCSLQLSATFCSMQTVMMRQRLITSALITNFVIPAGICTLKSDMYATNSLRFICKIATSLLPCESARSSIRVSSDIPFPLSAYDNFDIREAFDFLEG